ncbi:MAG: DUF4276 family protein [Candidatus Competibacteraceae bacterium]|nr:DUF4276 family protein [Candidatus Competibacteraceae bacterium]
MIRVHIICEGQTEETFIKDVMMEVFATKGIYLEPALVGRPGHKGGNLKFERLLTDVKSRLLSDQQCYCTTFFDFYGLPEDFPGKKDAGSVVEVMEKAEKITDALKDRIEEKIGQKSMQRFIPYVQMHEFEGLLFSDPAGFAGAIEKPELAGNFQSIRNGFETPEQINDSPVTAPSKRILDLFREYEKPLHGALAALEIGLGAIRQECQLFDSWLKKIEALAPKPSDLP